jgi:single-stranded DNA-specific DHH superfamily exonuclease
MKYIPEELIGQAINFFNTLQVSNSLAIIYHGDPDGCCAAVILTAALQESLKRKPEHIFWVGSHEFTFTSVRDYLAKVKPSHIVFLDLNIESKPEILDEIVMLTGSRIFIYDDHVSNFVPSREEILYINPTINLGTHFPRPACVFALELQQQLSNIDMRWVAGVGIIAESVSRYYNEFLDELPIERKILLNIAKLITAQYLAFDSDKTNDLAFLTLLEAGLHCNPRLFFERANSRVRQLHQTRSRVERALSRNVSQFNKRALIFEDVSLYVFQVQSKYRIANLVASTMKWKLTRSIILTYQVLPDRVIIEIRATPDLTDLDLTQILGKTFSDLPYFNMGGHPVAAGAAIAKPYIGAFIDRFYKSLKEEMVHDT